MESTIKEHLIAFGRTVLTAIITTVIILAGIALVLGEQTRQENELAEITLHANLAQACVLSLPIDPETGRDPDGIRLCFTQYDIEPPILATPDDQKGG